MPARFLALCICAAVSIGAQQPPHQWGLVPVKGSELYFEEAGSGPVVVLIHGGWLNSRQWDEQMQRFSKTYRVIRYDCRGYGRSPMGDSTYASYEDLAALLRHLDVQRANIIGVSQGAQVAIDFAEHYPEAVQSLLLGASPLAGFDMGKEFTSGMLGVISAGASDDLELMHARIWAFVHKSIPQSSIVRIKNAGHFPNIERPREFDRIALDWLKRVSVSRPGRK